MKKILTILTVVSLAVSAPAQSRVAASMVSVDTAGMTRLTNANQTVQEALKTLDQVTSQTSYAPRSAGTNTVITAVTPRWIGDLEVLYAVGGTNVQVWQSYGITTSSWFMLYPVQARMSTNVSSTNVAPLFAGQTLQINGATNILWRAFANTNNVLSWKQVYVGIP